MAKKLSFAVSRYTGTRLFRWSILAAAGVAGGMLLGNMAAETRLGGSAGEPASYSRLSANPDALVQLGNSAAPCLGCADSYGAALRLRAHHDGRADDRMSDEFDGRADDRMSDEFRELGAVDVDPPAPVEPADDYRYGGRFPDPQPDSQRPTRLRATPTTNTAAAAALDGGAPPTDEAPLPPPE